MNRLALPTVTLCAVTSVNLAATVAALRACLQQVEFAECLLLTDRATDCDDPDIRIVPIDRLTSAAAYSDFILRDLVGHVRTDHCLIIQWDGFVLDAGRWRSDFLDYDYVGASWPQFSDARDVGNGGFSLRSRKLLETCRDRRFRASHPEDLAICRDNRSMLEAEHGIRFADRTIADRFAFERTRPAAPTFGFHGSFNMIELFGADRFWETYLSLDDRRTVFADYWTVMRRLKTGRNAWARRLRFTLDRLSALAKP